VLKVTQRLDAVRIVRPEWVFASLHRWKRQPEMGYPLEGYVHYTRPRAPPGSPSKRRFAHTGALSARSRSRSPVKKRSRVDPSPVVEDADTVNAVMRDDGSGGSSGSDGDDSGSVSSGSDDAALLAQLEQDMVGSGVDSLTESADVLDHNHEPPTSVVPKPRPAARRRAPWERALPLPSTSTSTSTPSSSARVVDMASGASSGTSARTGGCGRGGDFLTSVKRIASVAAAEASSASSSREDVGVALQTHKTPIPTPEDAEDVLARLARLEEEEEDLL
jgi:hypothetical protein